MITIEYSTPTATCGGCGARITRAFTDVAGVESATLHIPTRRTTIVFDPAVIGPEQLVETLTEAGYAPDLTTGPSGL